MSDGGVHVSLGTIYEKVTETSEDVKTLIERFNSMQRTSDDHEGRIRDLESHGSSHAQELEKENIRTRSRLHDLENKGVFNTMALQLEQEARDADISKLTGTLDIERDERLSTKKTLLTLVFTALTIAGAVLVALIYVLAR